MVKTKKINNFKTSWKEISDIIHDMKSAVQSLINSREKQNEAMQKIIDGVEKIYDSIGKMADRNNEE